MNIAVNASAAAASRLELELGEVEDGIASTAILRHRENPAPPATFVDVLEISENPESPIQWHEGLDHDQLQQHLSEVGSF